MIFVTVGTHEQPFNRLIEYVDKLVEYGNISEEVILQIGYSTYEPKNCRWQRFFLFKEMAQKIADARIVITHGGPSSFIAPLQIGKIPIVVPRKKEFNEHVNNHQVEFSKAVAEKLKSIIVIEEIETLRDIIGKYDNIINTMEKSINRNNDRFCYEFGKIVNEIMKGKL